MLPWDILASFLRYVALHLFTSLQAEYSNTGMLLGYATSWAEKIPIFFQIIY